MNYQCRCRCAAANRRTARLPAGLKRIGVLTSQSNTWKGICTWPGAGMTTTHWRRVWGGLLLLMKSSLSLSPTSSWTQRSLHEQMVRILCGWLFVFSHWWKLTSTRWAHLETPVLVERCRVQMGVCVLPGGWGGVLATLEGAQRVSFLYWTGERAAKAVMLFYISVWSAAPKCRVSWFNLHLQKISACFLLPESFKHRILDFEPPTMILETFFVKVTHEPWGLCRLLHPSLSLSLINVFCFHISKRPPVLIFISRPSWDLLFFFFLNHLTYKKTHKMRQGLWKISFMWLTQAVLQVLQEASIYRGADFWLSFLPLWGPKSTIQSQAPLNVKQRCQTSFFCFTSSRLTLNVWFYCSCRENKRKQHLFSVMLLLTLQPTDLLLNTWFFPPLLLT